MHCPKGENSKIPVADTVTEYIFKVVSFIYEFINAIPSIRTILLGNYLKGGKATTRR